MLINSLPYYRGTCAAKKGLTRPPRLEQPGVRGGTGVPLEWNWSSKLVLRDHPFPRARGQRGPFTGLGP
jgi:hypothetical protein